MKRWMVLLGCFIGMSVATPAILLMPLGLFLKSITADYGWSRTQFSMIPAIAALVNALVLPIAGYLVDKFGARLIIGLGTALGCGSYAALSAAPNYGGFVAIMIVSVAMGNLASYPAFMGLAQSWFDRRLGLAFAITSTGLAVGAGGFSYVIAKTIQLHGWRTAFLTVGVAALAIGLANLLILVRENKGPIPEAERRDASARAAEPSGTLVEALKTREFWLYAVAFSLVVFAAVGSSFHLPALLSDHGASSVEIASVVALGSAGSLIGRFFSGIMLDRFSVRSVTALFFAGQALGLALLLNGLQWVLPAGFLLGSVQGAEIDVMGYVIARRFGRAAYARIYGMCFAITMSGAIAGPLTLARIFDRTGSYTPGLKFFLMLPALALALIWLATSPPRRPEGEAVPSFR